MELLIAGVAYLETDEVIFIPMAGLKSQYLAIMVEQICQFCNGDTLLDMLLIRLKWKKFSEAYRIQAFQNLIEINMSLDSLQLHTHGKSMALQSSVLAADSQLNINKLPEPLMNAILNYLSLNETFHTVHSVQRSWRFLTRNDGHLCIYSLKIEDQDLCRIINQHIRFKINSLDISYCSKITDDRLAPVSTLDSLTSLNISGCRTITDDGIKYLSALVNLRHLNLHGCTKITDVGLSYLANLPLTYLDLNGSDISDSGLRSLSAFSLTYLDVSSCKKITDLGISYLSQLPLTHLQVRNTNITDEGLKHLSKLPLKKLCLKNCYSLTD